MVEWDYWITNDSPPWLACQGVMAVSLVTCKKCPGVRPVVIGDVCRSVMKKFILHAGGEQAKEACRSINIYACLESGLERGIHAVREREGRGWVETGNEWIRHLQKE